MKKKEAFISWESFDNMGQELISLISTTLQEIGKQDVEAPTKADKIMLLPLAQKMSKIHDRYISQHIQTELIEGLGNTYGLNMARKESMECWLVRVPYYMFYYSKLFQAQLGVMAFLEAHK